MNALSVWYRKKYVFRAKVRWICGVFIAAKSNVRALLISPFVILNLFAFPLLLTLLFHPVFNGIYFVQLKKHSEKGKTFIK